MQNIKKILSTTAFAVLLLSGSVLFAGGAGSSSGLTLTESISAETAGISESAAALSGRIGLITGNPAAIHSLDGQDAAISYRAGFGDDSFASLLYGRAFSFISLGMALNYYSTGDIIMYDLAGDPVKKTGQRDAVILLGAARKFYSIPAGINLKLITSEIFGYSAIAFATDIGFQYTAFSERASAGIAVRNIGAGLTYIKETEPLPLNVIAGAAYSKTFTRDLLQFTAAFPYYINEEEILAKAGIEYRFANLLAFRAGSRMNFRGAGSFIETVNMGVGIAWEGYSLHYSISIADNLNNPHNVSLRMGF